MSSGKPLIYQSVTQRMKRMNTRSLPIPLVDPTLPQHNTDFNPQQIIPITPDEQYKLTNSDLKYAYDISKQCPKWEYKKIQFCLASYTHNDNIRQIDPDEFQENCKLAFAQFRGEERRPLYEKTISSSLLYLEKIKFLKDPTNLNSRNIPGEPIHIGP